MTAEALKLDGYVRVSSVRGRGGDTFISPAQQRDRIHQWAAAYGHIVVELHEELDESGSRADRPQLLRAIERVERGEINGIVVAKLDRFARSLVDGLQLIERITKAGGTFVSVADGLDLTTDTGRLVLRIMLSLAEFELDRVRGNWHDAKARAVMRGIHPSAHPPFGYKRIGPASRQSGKPTGPLVIDEHTGPLVTELYARRKKGQGPAQLCDFLEAAGAVTATGRSDWSQRAVKDILRNRVYIGEAYAGEIRNPDAHPPLVDRVTFDAVQYRGVQFQPKAESPSPIAPLLRCAGCRYKMRSESRDQAHGRVWYFTCKDKHGQRVAWTCDHPAAIKDAGDLEAAIVNAFFDRLPALEARRRVDDPRLTELEFVLANATHAFEEWRDDARIQEQLGMDAYLAGLVTRQDALNAALADVGAERARIGALELPAEIADIRAQWNDLTAGDQRALLGSVIKCVFIRGSSRTAALPGRLKIVWHGEAVELPARGLPWTPAPVAFSD